MKRSSLIGAALLAASAGVAHAQVGEKVPVGGSFAIDRTEVTIGQFRAYVLPSSIVTAAERDGGGFEFTAGWQRRPGWNVYQPFGRPSSPRQPAVHLNWAEAEAYCSWAGGRLPTAAEWQTAAYTETRTDPPAPFATGRTYRYPTGETPDGANTNRADAWLQSAEAGATRVGVNGLYDMGGNVWEWVSDQQGNSRRTMGGSWWYGPEQMTRDVVAYKEANFYAVYVGFRCVYDLPAG